MLTLLLTLFASGALATNNRTIAISGRDGFDDLITGMCVWDGKLLLNGANQMYMWSEEDGLVEVTGFSAPSQMLEPILDEDEESRHVHLGQETIALDEGESLSLGGYLFATEDALYQMVVKNGLEGAQQAFLVELVIGDDHAVSLGEAVDLGDDLLVDTGLTVVMPYFMHSCEMDGVIYADYMDESDGTDMLAMIDPQTGDVDTETFDPGADVASLAPYGDGKLMVAASDGRGIEFSLYDVDDGGFDTLGTLQTNGVPSGLCYDEARGKVYYVLAGSVWRADVTEKGLGNREAFGDMPLDLFGSASPVLMGDMYVLASFDGVIGRDVTVDGMPTQHLTLAQSDGATDAVSYRAYFDFTGRHPEFAVNIGQEIGETDAFLRAMMSRSSAVDIYVMRCGDAAFSSLKSHGFMADLSASQTLKDYVDSLYPSFAQAAYRDGKLCAIPIDATTEMIGINVTAFTEKLGYTEEDVPETWPDLLALLAELSDGRMKDVPEVTVFSPYSTYDSARNNLFSQMMNDYMLWLSADDAHLARGNDVLLALLTAFEQIDWDGFDLPEEQEIELWAYQNNSALLEPAYLSTQNTSTTEGDVRRPLTLAVAQGEQPLAGTQLTLAFVNPYSKHLSEAIEYLEIMKEMLSVYARIDMIPTMNDPVENKDYENILKSYEKSLAQYDDSIAIAQKREDDETAANLEMLKEIIQGLYDDFAANGKWEISPEGIEAYRESAQYVVPAYSTIWGTESVLRQGTQYLDGTISARQFVSAMEKTLQMQRQEQM